MLFAEDFKYYLRLHYQCPAPDTQAALHPRLFTYDYLPCLFLYPGQQNLMFLFFSAHLVITEHSWTLPIFSAAAEEQLQVPRDHPVHWGTEYFLQLRRLIIHCLFPEIKGWSSSSFVLRAIDRRKGQAASLMHIPNTFPHREPIAWKMLDCVSSFPASGSIWGVTVLIAWAGILASILCGFAIWANYWTSTGLSSLNCKVGVLQPIGHIS